MMTWLLLVTLLAEKKIAFDALPAPVKATVQKTFGKSKIVSVEEEHEEGRLVYEVKAKHEGHLVELALSPDGAILGEERELELTQAPPAVQRAVAASLPSGAKIDRVEQVTEGGVVSFELAVRKPDGARVEMIVQGDGGVVIKPERD